eukprot:tig00021070_g17869.t1
MTLETLQAIVPLAPTLKRLKCGVIVSEALLPVFFSSIAAFQQLEQLIIEVYKEDGSELWPRASEADLQPLSGLSSLRAYAVYVDHMHAGFLSGMRQLDNVCLNMRGPVDISVLLPHAGSLRRAIFNYTTADQAVSTSFTAVASKLAALEELILTLPSRIYSALAHDQLSLKQWTSLKSVNLACTEANSAIPGAFLKRLASEVPSLQTLTVRSPLPVKTADGLVAVGSLNRLRRLVLEGEAPSAADADTRSALRGALLHVQISYE